MMPPSNPSPTRRFVGVMLMVVGGLIAVTCGLCTGVFEFIFLRDLWHRRSIGGFDDWATPVFLPLALGVLPILIGTALFIWGRRLYRRPARSLAVDEF